MKRIIGFCLVLIALTVWGLAHDCFAGDFGEIKFADKKFVYRDQSYKTMLVTPQAGVNFQFSADAVIEFSYDKDGTKLMIIKAKRQTCELALDKVKLIAIVNDILEVIQ